MNTVQPLKILLADSEYSQYLALKRLFTESRRCPADLYWCGEHDQCEHAILTGTYDLILLAYSEDSFVTLEHIEAANSHTPVVLMVDHLSEELFVRVNACGVRGYVSRKHPDIKRLDRYLSFALWYRKQDAVPAFTPSAPRDRVAGNLALQ